MNARAWGSRKNRVRKILIIVEAGLDGYLHRFFNLYSKVFKIKNLKLKIYQR